MAALISAYNSITVIYSCQQEFSQPAKFSDCCSRRIPVQCGQEFTQRRALPMAQPGRRENPLERTDTNELYRGSLIREMRQKRGLSREKMANLLGCHPDSVSKMETNGVNPSPLMLEKIAEVLRFPLKELQQAPVHPRLLNRKVAPVARHGRRLPPAMSGAGTAAVAGAFGAGAGLGALLPRSRTGQQQTDTASQQPGQDIGLLVKQIVTEAQLPPEKRMLAEQLIEETARTVCEVLAKEGEEERR
jgi:ribosome-binding protein aMBF1 (putative translation factor)